MTNRGIEAQGYYVGTYESGGVDYYAYAFATVRGESGVVRYPLGNYIDIYGKCEDGNYRRLRYDNTSIIGGLGTVTRETALTKYATNTVGGNYPASTGVTEILVPLTTISQGIITGGCWWFKAQGAVSVPSGNILFSLYNMKPDEDVYSTTPLATAIIAKSSYATSFQGASDFYVYFEFSKPVVVGSSGNGINSNNTVALGMRLDAYTGSGATDFTSGGVTSTGTYYIRSDSQFIAASDNRKPLCAINVCGAKQFYTEPDNNGMATAFMGISKVAAATGLTDCDMTGLDLVIAAQGIKDDSSGTITGTANTLLSSPYEVICFLSHYYNGTEWATDRQPNIDAADLTLLQTGDYARSIAGKSEGGSNIDALGEILRESTCFIMPCSMGSVLRVYGQTYTPVATLTDDNSFFNSWSKGSYESIINNAVISFGKGLIDITTGNSTMLGETYGETVQCTTSTDDLWEYAEQSQLTYGIRPLSRISANWLGDYDSANVYLKWLLTNYDHPDWCVSITQPVKESFYDIANYVNNGIVVNISSAMMPAYFGASNDLVRYQSDGTEIDPNHGRYSATRQTYRAQIIGWSLEWSLEAGLLVTYKARVISPYHPNDIT